MRPMFVRIFDDSLILYVPGWCVVSTSIAGGPRQRLARVLTENSSRASSNFSASYAANAEAHISSSALRDMLADSFRCREMRAGAGERWECWYKWWESKRREEREKEGKGTLDPGKERRGGRERRQR